LRGVCEAGVVAVGALEVFAEADDRRKMQGVQRAQLGRFKLAGGLDDRLVDGERSVIVASAVRVRLTASVP
jgi:hypothetical protein